MSRIDQVLEYAVLALPILFGVIVEIMPKNIRDSRPYRILVIVFGFAISGIVWVQITHAEESANIDRKNAIIETASETSSLVNIDLKKNVYAAFQAYNDAHPQHKVDAELVQQIAKATNPLVFAQTSGNPSLGSLSDESLAELSRSEGKKLAQRGDKYWIRKADDIDNSYASARNHAATKEERDSINKEMVAKIAAARIKYDKESAALIHEADAIRKAVLEKLGSTSAEDKAAETRFAAALQGDIHNFDFDSNGYYLERLADRLSPPKN